VNLIEKGLFKTLNFSKLSCVIVSNVSDAQPSCQTRTSFPSYVGLNLISTIDFSLLVCCFTENSPSPTQAQSWPAPMQGSIGRVARALKRAGQAFSWRPSSHSCQGGWKLYRQLFSCHPCQRRADSMGKNLPSKLASILLGNLLSTKSLWSFFNLKTHLNT